MMIRILKISTGKTVRRDGPSQYRRATRHKDVFQYSIGAEGLYLLYRFHTNGEFQIDDDHSGDINFLDLKKQ